MSITLAILLDEIADTSQRDQRADGVTCSRGGLPDQGAVTETLHARELAISFLTVVVATTTIAMGSLGLLLLVARLSQVMTG